MAQRIRYHTEHASRHSGGRDQIIAISASECGVAKNAGDDGYSKMGCFERQNVGTFTAESIDIKGGDYRWTDTKDGYFTVHDVPLMSECPKATKGAPYEVTKEVLEEFVATAQRRYNEGRFCATAFKGHNPEIPISHPDFKGFVLPNRVGKYKLDDGEKWTIFGDVKLSAGAFQEAKQGKLPYLSPEVPWDRRRIRGLSFLDTLPPYHEYALFTIGEESTIHAARFEVTAESAAKFMADEHKPEDDMEKIAKYMDEELPKRLAKYMDEEMPKHFAKAMAKFTSTAGKPDATPVEPTTNKEGAKMTLDPEFAAKFAAIQNDNAEIKAKLAGIENEKKAKVLVEKAEQSLSKKVVTGDLLGEIGRFAQEAVTKAQGEQWFEKFVASLKPSLRDKPPANMGEFMGGASASSIDAQDPAVAKFAQEGPEVMEQVAKFAAQWRSISGTLGDRYQCREEDFIKNELMLWKAKRNGTLQEARR